MTSDAADLLACAVDAARAAGSVLRDRPVDLAADAKSTPTDVVTEMDHRAELTILDVITRRRPDDGILAEESGGKPGATGITWVIDPLDGTVNYLYGIPHYAVSIAARVDEEEVAGVVYDVCRDQTYTAVKDSGAYCDDVRLRVSAQSDPAFALTATGFAYAAATREWQAQVLTQVLPGVRDIRRMGSAALDLCAVAAGRVDAFFEAGMFPWDWAAGSLIVREAGGVVTGLAGGPPGEWTTVATNPGLLTPLVELLRTAGADQGAGVPPAAS